MTWPFTQKMAPPKKSRFPLSFYNTLCKEKETFELPGQADTVRMYNCGPTVYDTSHIGNLRSYVFADTVRRTLEYNGFDVKQAINITDFGHLSSDADSGHDKMTKALKREGMELSLENMRTLADRYIEEFYRDLRALNIDTDRILFPRASDHIQGEIAMVHTLEEKGYTYRGKDGVYFDTSRFPEYGKLGNIDIAGLKKGARVTASDEKKSPSDFLLWKSDKKLGWDSPWGKGFPGWHIECSAMIRATLGQQIDIHTGGIDLLPTHHNNEIAQSESAMGKRPLSRFWMHHEFLNLEKEKISKSIGNVINLPAIIGKGYHPLAYRYFLLGAHYRTPLNFTYDALDAAQTAYLRLRNFVREADDGGIPSEEWRVRIIERINDDLDIPGALGEIWAMTKEAGLTAAAKRATILDIDRILGLGLAKEDDTADAMITKLVGRSIDIANAPDDVQLLVEEREKARSEKNYARADELRAQLTEKGFTIEDLPEGPALRKR